VNPKWQTILGIGTLRESSKQWRIVTSFVVSVLTVTAFVTGLNLNRAEKTVPFSYYLPEDSTSYCMGVGASKMVNIATDLYWSLPNGSHYEVFPIMDFCPTSQTMLLMGAINTVDPQSYGYGDNGVAVRPQALGTTGSFYAPSFPIPASKPQIGLSQIMKQYRTDLVRVNGCSPVLSRNPFQCTKIDVGFNSANSNLSVSSDTNPCSISKSVYQDNDYVFKICLHGSVGEGTLLIGHIGTAAIYAAEAMGDHQQRQSWEKTGFSQGQTMLYGVECSISTSIRARDLTLTIADDSVTSGAFTRTLDGGADCELAVDYGVNQLKASVAAGVYQPLYAGWIQHIRLVAITPNGTVDYVRSGPYAFRGSQSALEDVLGLTAALSLSRVTLTGRPPSVEAKGSAVVLYNRVGPGKTWALVFVLPPVINVLVLAILWRKGKASIPVLLLGLTSNLDSLERYISRQEGNSNNIVS
jgi:hypothetical protein